jgi:hypothetical protein
MPCAIVNIPGHLQQWVREDFKPAAFDSHSEDRESVAFEVFAARRLVRLTTLSAIQAAVRSSLSSVKNGTEQCAPGTPFSGRVKPDGGAKPKAILPNGLR